MNKKKLLLFFSVVTILVSVVYMSGSTPAIAQFFPTLTLRADPIGLPAGGGTTILTWTLSNANANHCTATGAWSGGRAAWEGDTWMPVNLVTSGTYTFNLECWTWSGTEYISTGVKSAQVTVAAAATGCSAQTISNCSLSNTASGGYSGTCNTSGICSYFCNNGTWNYDFGGCSAPPANCSGQTISNCSLSNTASGGYSGTCNTSGICSYFCNNGTWNYDFGGCSAPVYSCTGTTPTNATLCSGDDSGLTVNTNRTAVANVSSCTATKCEYACNSGYVLSGGSCVLTPATITNYKMCYGTGGCTGGSALSEFNFSPNEERTLYSCSAGCGAGSSPVPSTWTVSGSTSAVSLSATTGTSVTVRAIQAGTAIITSEPQ